MGLEPGEKLEVDDQMRVAGREWLYAVGDVNGRALLTHMGKYQARVAADDILGKQVSATQDGPGSPRVIFTDPEVAAVGHTLDRRPGSRPGRARRRPPDSRGRRRQLPGPQRAGDEPPGGRRAAAG